HAGDSVGCAIWDGWEVLQGVDPERVGFYFDPAQAHIEGAKNGWNLGFRRVSALVHAGHKRLCVGEERQRLADTLGTAGARHGPMAGRVRVVALDPISRTHLFAYRVRSGRR